MPRGAIVCKGLQVKEVSRDKRLSMNLLSSGPPFPDIFRARAVFQSIKSRGEGYAVMMMGGTPITEERGRFQPRGVPWNREAAAAVLSPNLRKLWYRH